MKAVTTFSGVIALLSVFTGVQGREKNKMGLSVSKFMKILCLRVLVRCLEIQTLKDPRASTCDVDKCPKDRSDTKSRLESCCTSDGKCGYIDAGTFQQALMAAGISSELESQLLSPPKESDVLPSGLDRPDRSTVERLFDKHSRKPLSFFIFSVLGEIADEELYDAFEKAVIDNPRDALSHRPRRCNPRIPTPAPCFTEGEKCNGLLGAGCCYITQDLLCLNRSKGGGGEGVCSTGTFQCRKTGESCRGTFECCPSLNCKQGSGLNYFCQ